MADVLQNLLTSAGLAFKRLSTVKAPPQAVEFFRELGYEIPQASFGPSLPALATQAQSLAAAATALASATDEAVIFGKITAMFTALKGTIEAIEGLRAEILVSGPIPDLEQLPRRLADFLILDYAKARSGGGFELLHVAGLIEDDASPAPGTPANKINWNRFGKILSEPGTIFDEVYGWQTDLDFATLIARLETFMRVRGFPGGVYPQAAATVAALGGDTPDSELRFTLLQSGLTTATYSQFGVSISPVTATATQKKGIALMPYITGGGTFNFSVCDRGQLDFSSTADLRGIGIVLRPPLEAQGILGMSGSFDLSLKIHETAAAATEHILLGTAGGTRLAIQGLGVNWFANGTREKLDLGVEGQIDALRLVIRGGDGDGFLSKVLSGVNVQAETALAFGISLANGFTFKGGGKLTLDIGAHVSAGPIEITGFRIALSPNDAGIGLATGAMLKFDLGPMHAVVENIGIKSMLKFSPGNLGPVDLDFGFLPPDGIGLSLDAGGFKGGGYLKFDSDRGEYAGALELDFQGLCSVKAIAIINTKMPDGTPGYSMLILISAEFVPIQLSFGFTLNGVGGLFGLNRSVNTDALIEGLRTNAVKSVLFPVDVIANITRIISDIKQFFPPNEGHFAVGPMGKLGWGTPSIITAEIGILLDLPVPMVAIVGVLRAVMPSADAPILKLQVNFLGELNFDKGYVRFRADLFDSRLLVYSITGSMAFLVSWGETKTFALSVGGFHPDFRDVPAIPAAASTFANMARIGLSFLSDDNPRLKAESYFAVTSNTVQFGAKVELYASAMGFNVYGFVGYDVLFHFEPFQFQADLSGGIALREGTDVIAGIHISAKLSGPHPWDARGKATFSVLFFDIDVGFHVTWGDPPDAVNPQTEDLLGRLKTEYADTRNWRADLPPQNHLHVSLRTLDPPKDGDPLIVHPAGVLTFSQKVLPVEDFVIEKFGTKKPLAENHFRFSSAVVNAQPVEADFTGVREQFAPAQFTEMSDADKISSASFRDLASGFALTGSASLAGSLPVTRDAEYELNYLRKKPVRTEPVGLFKARPRVHQRFGRGSATRRSVLAQQQVRVSMNAPPAVDLPKEEYVVASTSDLTMYQGTGASVRVFSSEYEARQYQRSLVQGDPLLAGELQVVAKYEAVSA